MPSCNGESGYAAVFDWRSIAELLVTVLPFLRYSPGLNAPKTTTTVCVAGLNAPTPRSLREDRRHNAAWGKSATTGARRLPRPNRLRFGARIVHAEEGPRPKLSATLT